MKKYFFIILLFSSLLSLLGFICGPGTGMYDDYYYPVEGVSLSKNELTIMENSTAELLATIIPADAQSNNITWQSSDISIATVESGLVKGISAGTATITVIVENEETFTATCTVTVIKAPIAVTGVTLDKTDLFVGVGQARQLAATVEPSGATNQNITWESDAPLVATVSSNGLVRGLSEGTAVITVKTEDSNFTNTCTVTVSNDVIAPTVISVSPVSGGNLHYVEIIQIVFSETMAADTTISGDLSSGVSAQYWITTTVANDTLSLYGTWPVGPGKTISINAEDSYGNVVDGGVDLVFDVYDML